MNADEERLASNGVWPAGKPEQQLQPLPQDGGWQKMNRLVSEQ